MSERANPSGKGDVVVPREELRFIKSQADMIGRHLDSCSMEPCDCGQVAMLNSINKLLAASPARETDELTALQSRCVELGEVFDETTGYKWLVVARILRADLDLTNKRLDEANATLAAKDQELAKVREATIEECAKRAFEILYLEGFSAGLQKVVVQGIRALTEKPQPAPKPVCSVWNSLSAHGNCRDCGHPKEDHPHG